MTEQAAPAAAPPVQAAGLPSQPAHESIGQRVGDLFHRAEAELPVARAIAEDVQPLLHGHVAAIFTLASRVLTDPALKPLRADVLELAVSAAKLAGISL